jgi:putative NADH-flavin reductase
MNKMMMALFCERTELSYRIIDEVVSRGHTMVAIVANKYDLKIRVPNFKVITGNVKNREEVKRLVTGHNVVLSAIEPVKSVLEYLRIINELFEGAKQAKVESIIIAGHPLSIPMIESASFYYKWKPVAQAQIDALKLLGKKSGAEWTYVHTANLEPNPKSGLYKIATDVELANSHYSKIKIPIKEYISGLIDAAVAQTKNLNKENAPSLS